MDRLTGIHAVREALEANRPLDSMIVARRTHGNRIEDLVRLARQHGVPVRFEERVQVDRAAGSASIRASSRWLRHRRRQVSRIYSSRAIRLVVQVWWFFSTGSRIRKILVQSCELHWPPVRKASLSLNAAPPGLLTPSRERRPVRSRSYRLRASRICPVRWRK